MNMHKSLYTETETPEEISLSVLLWFKDDKLKRYISLFHILRCKKLLSFY